MSLFKSAIIYRIGAGWAAPDTDKLEAELERTAFAPCGPTQEVSVGWVPPRGEDHGALMEIIGNQRILKLFVERKAVPASAVKAEVDQRCKQLEGERGRPVGRKEKRELKEEAYLTLLPRAFSKKSSHFVWLDVENRVIVVGAGGHKSADLVMGHLVELCATVGTALPVAPLSTQMTPAAAMSGWLTAQEAPAHFSIDRDLELKSFEDDKASVRYARHTLELAEIVEHIKQGKVPLQLGMTFDSRVSFTLTAESTLKKIELLDVVTEVDGESEGFDGDVALTTGELEKLIPALINALGGELPQTDAPSEGE